MRVFALVALAVGTIALAQRTSRLVGPPELNGCYQVSALDLDAGTYSRVRLCADSDGGIDFPPGQFLLYPDPDDSTDYACACAASSECLRVLEDGGTEPAPKALTLRPGQWSGTCLRKTCVELAGFESMPGACR